MSLPATIAAQGIEPPQLPDVNRLERMPSWPAWVGSRIGSLKIEVQPDKISGKWRPVPTLPAGMILKAEEGEVLTQHIAGLRVLMNQTPLNELKAEQMTLVLVTKLMMACSAATQNELSAEARGEAFMAALDDVPTWAVKSAIRGWHRGQCGNNNRGEAYDYHWCPAPAELRYIACMEVARVSSRADILEKLLRAEPLIEFSDEHCRQMRVRIAKLFRNLGTSPVGSTAAVEQPGKPG